MFARFPRHLVSGVAPAVVVFVAALGTFVACTPAEAAQVSQDMRITMSDGVSLQATLTGQAPLSCLHSSVPMRARRYDPVTHVAEAALWGLRLLRRGADG